MALKFDPEQKAAIRHIDGPFLCIAGPGSGKTTVIVHRVVNLVKHGIEPSKILVLTFGKDAAMELETRYLGIRGSMPGPNFSTIHAFAKKVVMMSAKYQDYQVMDENKVRTCLREILSNDSFHIRSGIDADNFYKAIEADISKYRLATVYKEMSFQPDAFGSIDDLQQVFHHYQTYKKINGFLDFDDMLYGCMKMFLDDPFILEQCRRTFDYIMVDEFQDTSMIQANIIYALAAPKNNLFICGDDDQSIYGWRDAKPDIMLGFEKRYSGCGISRLVTNYRSGSNIVQASKSLIDHNIDRYKKELTGNSNNQGQILKFHLTSTSDKRKLFADEIKSYHKQGIPFYEMAILTRTNKESYKIAAWLMEENIPFYCSSGMNDPYQSTLYKCLIAYLKIAYGLGNWEDLKTIINRPYRRISRDLISSSNSLDKLLENAKIMDAEKGGNTGRRVAGLIQLLKQIESYANYGHSLQDTIRYIWSSVNFAVAVKEICSYEHLDEYQLLDDYEMIVDKMEEHQTLQSFLNNVQNLQRIYKQCISKNAQNKDRGITISTIHSAKGLEWHIVWIASCNQGNIPLFKDPCDLSRIKMEEERRLMYVAITRARQKCILILDDKKVPSGFLGEVFPICMKEESDDATEHIET